MVFPAPKKLALFFLMYSLLLGLALAASADESRFEFRGGTEIAHLLAEKDSAASAGEQTVFLSNHFINLPYAADTLIGGPQQAEQLIINLEAFDCFTFLDVLEALRRSRTADDFIPQLVKVRYFDDIIAYGSRRHFFSDWLVGASPVQDVTAAVGQGRSINVQKQLNRKTDGSFWLPGIKVHQRRISYIPSVQIGSEILSALQPGDYVGIYSSLDGLDVSHVGLIVNYENQLWLRHASSREGVNKIVDDELTTYLQGTPGLLVYRVKP